MHKILPENNEQVVKEWRKDSHSIEKYRFIHHFLPHPHHRTKAKLISNKAIVIYCLIFVLLFSGIKVFTKVYPGVLGYASDIKIRELLELSNAKREEKGLSELRLNPALTRAAQKKADDMFKEGYWAHVSPKGTEPWDFILSEHYEYIYAGENLAKNFNSSREVVEAWYNSPSHRENLLNKNYDEIGFAVVNGVLDGYETTLVVQMFGRPRDPSYIASSEEENRLLESVAVERSIVAPEVPVAVNIPGTQLTVPTVPIEPSYAGSQAVNVPAATKYISILFGLYIGVLLVLDIWYSRRHAIFKISGHSLAHLSLLFLIILGMLLSMMPGKIL